jgi:hypothetical protein
MRFFKVKWNFIQAGEYSKAEYETSYLEQQHSYLEHEISYLEQEYSYPI